MKIINHNKSEVEHYEWNGTDYESKQDVYDVVYNLYKGYVIRNESESKNGYLKTINFVACGNKTENFIPRSTKPPRGTAKYASTFRTYPPRTGTIMSRNFIVNNNGGNTPTTL